MDEPLAILYEDAHVLTVNKPQGVPTQGVAGTSLEETVRRYLNASDPGSVYLGTVHRLDRPVSGVIVWAKTPKASRRLAGEFASRSVTKEYWAIVEDSASGLPAEGTWDDWLTSPDTGVRARVVPPETPGARRAITRYRRGDRSRTPEGTVLLLLRPETGRTHQLRAQAAFRDSPILGDRTYGSIRSFPDGIALHARSLGVTHPILRKAMTWIAPLPESWREFGAVLPVDSFPEA